MALRLTPAVAQRRYALSSRSPVTLINAISSIELRLGYHAADKSRLATRSIANIDGLPAGSKSPHDAYGHSLRHGPDDTTPAPPPPPRRSPRRQPSPTHAPTARQRGQSPATPTGTAFATARQHHSRPAATHTAGRRPPAHQPSGTRAVAPIHRRPPAPSFSMPWCRPGGGGGSWSVAHAAKS